MVILTIIQSVLEGIHRHFTLGGKPVSEVNRLEKHCDSGHVVTSEHTKSFCREGAFEFRRYSNDRDESERHNKIYTVLAKSKPPLTIGEKLKDGITEESIKIGPIVEAGDSKRDGSGKDLAANFNRRPNRKSSIQESFVREACKLKANKLLLNYISDFVSPTVREILNGCKDISALSEIRQFTILFVNLSFNFDEAAENFHSILAATLQQALSARV